MKKVQFVANMSDIQLEVELDKYNGVKKIIGVIAYGDIDDFDILPTKFKEEKMINAETRYQIYAKIAKEQKENYERVVEYLKYTKHSKKKKKHMKYIQKHKPIVEKVEKKVQELKLKMEEAQEKKT